MKIDKIKYNFILFIIAFFSFVIMLYLNNALDMIQAINIDDIASVQFAMLGGDNVFAKLRGILNNDPTNVPLFYFLLYVWIKLFGYLPSVMRLLPELIIAISVYLIGLLGKEIANKKVGILCAFLSATSIQCLYASFQIRAYSMLILNATILMLAYKKRGKTIWNEVIYVISLWLLSFTHFFGVLCCFTLGLWDLFKVITKNKKITFLIPYFVYCVIFVPYLAISYLMASNMYGSFWPPVPNCIDIARMLYKLSPLGWIGLFFCLTAIIYTFISIKSIKDNFKDNEEKEFIKLCVWNIVWVLIICFVYSRYINPKSSIWVFRYFLVIYPCVVVLVGKVFDLLLDNVSRKLEFTKKINISIYIAIVFVLSIYNIEYALNNAVQINNGNELFYNTAEYLNDNNLIESKKTVLYMPYPNEYFDGWKEFSSRGCSYNLKMVCTLEQLKGVMTEECLEIYTSAIVYEIPADAMDYILQEFDIAENDCAGIPYLNKYTRR